MQRNVRWDERTVGAGRGEGRVSSTEMIIQETQFQKRRNRIKSVRASMVPHQPHSHGLAHQSSHYSSLASLGSYIGNDSSMQVVNQVLSSMPQYQEDGHQDEEWEDIVARMTADTNGKASGDQASNIFVSNQVERTDYEYGEAASSRLLNVADLGRPIGSNHASGQSRVFLVDD
ncbi:hypothetical protein CYMTET_36683 [Cymbomonas tetramitiformis]|uniref:Uncharacterized protein n=1 Tax=Cymbomonas tetramitiformis TaxID=36881 RepID=A0AAE0CGQ6_9CHLO|nr:hypothetical protein CYMTET_36683 [Cymbomonas tetramitiformis]